MSCESAANRFVDMLGKPLTINNSRLTIGPLKAEVMLKCTKNLKYSRLGWDYSESKRCKKSFLLKRFLSCRDLISAGSLFHTLGKEKSGRDLIYCLFVN